MIFDFINLKHTHTQLCSTRGVFFFLSSLVAGVPSSSPPPKASSERHQTTTTTLDKVQTTFPLKKGSLDTNFTEQKRRGLFLVYDDDDGPAHCDDKNEEQLDDATTNAWSQNEAARKRFS